MTNVLSPKRHGAGRVASIDAARGAAMFFVCLAHFANSYQALSEASQAGGYLVIVGMVASPTFVTMSGLVAGFLFVTRGSSFTTLRYKLIDRGVFLMLIGHTILALSGLLTGHDLGRALRVGYITDVIGFSVIVGPTLVATTSARMRVLLALGIFTLSWSAVIAWAPSAAFGTVAKHYLVGVPNPADWTIGDFPLLPWFAVYLAGTVIGQRLGSEYNRGRVEEGNLLLAKFGLGVFAFGVAAKSSLMLLRAASPVFLGAHRNVGLLLSSYQKFPPGPVYVSFFGGAGMLMVAAILEAGRRGVLPFLMNQLRQIGLASLFVYVLQYYVYVVTIRTLHLPYTPFWPVLFALSVVVLATAAKLWNTANGNRFLTVGIGPLLEWNVRRRMSSEASMTAAPSLIKKSSPPQTVPTGLA